MLTNISGRKIMEEYSLKAKGSRIMPEMKRLNTKSTKRPYQGMVARRFSFPWVRYSRSSVNTLQSESRVPVMNRRPEMMKITQGMKLAMFFARLKLMITS